jgi:hypothetical protein
MHSNVQERAASIFSFEEIDPRLTHGKTNETFCWKLWLKYFSSKYQSRFGAVSDRPSEKAAWRYYVLFQEYGYFVLTIQYGY